jgi:imidazoleglycerol phosphate synthase, cyclase subunit
VTLTKRVVVCLDVLDGRVVKGTRFVNLRDIGDPVALAERYERDGADEIVFLDIGATPNQRETILALAQQAAERLFIPLTIGGGIRSVEDMAMALRAGADKVSVNSAAITDPELLSQAAARFGSQCVVVSIDAKRRSTGDGWEVYAAGGRRATGLDAIVWARDAAARGAGEILLTSIDRDGARDGYDVDLTRAVASVVDVPIVASGGAGSADHVADVLRVADAALVAGVLHDGVTTVGGIKQRLTRAGIPVRETTMNTATT